MITRLRYSWVVVVLATAACGGRAASDTSVTPARMAPPDPVATCSDWVQRANADPQLAVERVPAPVKFDPAPIPKRLAKGVLGTDGRAEVRIRVLVDTLGAADMTTFTVVKSTSPTLTRSVRSAIAKWKFTPAEVSGCKVPRNFNWAAVSPAPNAGDDENDAR